MRLKKSAAPCSRVCSALDISEIRVEFSLALLLLTLLGVFAGLSSEGLFARRLLMDDGPDSTNIQLSMAVTARTTKNPK